jgi:hypothetical protein
MSSVHPWVARSQLKLYLFLDESISSANASQGQDLLKLTEKKHGLWRRLKITGRRIDATNS